MSNISAIIFDCDGVMFDSRQANVQFYNHLLAHFGLPPMNEADVDFVHMHTAHESVKKIFRGTPFVEAAQAYRMGLDYSPFIQYMIIEPGLKELLRILKPRFGLAVATNRSNTIGTVLEVFGLAAFFDIVVSSLDVKRPKPHPESLLTILEFFEIGPERALYVGDSEVDFITAEAAGVPFVSYGNDGLETPWRVARLLELTDILEAVNSGAPPDN